jgi:serine protease DegS
MLKTLRNLLLPVAAGLLAALVVIRFWPQEAAAPQPAAEPSPAAQAEQIVTQQETRPILPVQGPVSYAEAVEHAAPAVVNIYTRKTVETPISPLFSDPLFRQFFGGNNVPTRKRMESSLGSGVILNAQGAVVTNHHVVSGADEIVVALRDGREARATLVGSDPETDLAVLRIDLKDLPVSELRDSGDLRVGDVVLAIGNPFGVGQTVTIGIISATGRSELGINTFEDFIQTDAAINPGNSGGALVDAQGRVVGINSAIFSRSGGYQGIGFAIPTRIARQVVSDLLAHGRVIRGWLGVETQPLTAELAHALKLPESSNGVLIAGVLRDGPAHRSGIRPGDVVVKVGRHPVATSREFIQRIAAHAPGSSAALTLLREGKEMQLDAVVGERPTDNGTTR